jgi:hypothetical protein
MIVIQTSFNTNLLELKTEDDWGVELGVANIEEEESFMKQELVNSIKPWRKIK